MIRRLARSIREYKWAAMLSPLCMVGEVTMEILIPLVIADLIDKGIDAGNMAEVWKQGGLLALCALCSLGFGVASAFFASYARTWISGNFVGRIKGAKCPFDLQFLTWDFS